MPKVDPFAYIMSSLSTMTGGLIADMQTLILGIILISFLVFGFEWLIEIIDGRLEETARGRNFDRAKNALAKRNSFSKGSVEYDQASLEYRRFLTKSVKQ